MDQTTYGGGEMERGRGGMSPINEAGARRSWWSRNWKWVVPAGVILPLLLCGTCFFGVFYAAMQGLKTAEVTKQAVRMAEADPHVQAALGSPLRVGRFVAGSIEISKGTGGGGEAALSIPLSGPKGSGTLEVRATRAQDAWTYSRLELVPAAGGPAINVLEDG